MSTTVVQVDTIQIVYSDNTRTPLIGPDSPDGEEIFAPWKWDERMWTDEYFENSERAIPVLGDQDVRGIPETYWQSGVGSDRIDLEVLEPVALREESQERWTVKIRHGNYYKFHKSRYLFADRSLVQFVDNTENESSRNVLQLDEIPRYGSPILATMWTRDQYGEPLLYKNIQKRMQFTGLYSGGVEQETIDSDGNIVWPAVDTSHREFVVQWTGDKTTAPKLYFSQDFTFLYGKETVSDEDDLRYCDFLGEGKGEDEELILFTKYFPIMDNDELKVYKVIDGVPTVMLRWDPELRRPPDPEYAIDTDRGEITFPAEINGELSNIVPPDYGVQIYAVYRPTVEVEYEPDTCNNFLTAPYINMNPVMTSTNRGFLYLTERELRVAYLVLSADTTVIDEDIYGPIYMGSDYCFLVATAYNNRGQPVPGVEVSFYLDSSDDGRLNGAIALTGSEVVATTDGEGQARVVYSSPRSLESTGQYVTHENGVDTQSELTLVHTNGITSDSLDSLFVYQVFNDDGMQKWYPDEDAGSGEEPGHGGRKVVLYRKTIASELGGGDETTATNRFAGDSDDLHPRTGIDGGSTNVWMPLRPVSLTGGNVLGFEYDGSPQNLPWTEDPPSDWELSTSYSINDLVWHNPTWKWYKALTNHTSTANDEPGVGVNWETNWVEDANAGNLVAYWISGGKQVPAHAKCFSYLYNDWIDSNDIEFRVAIPQYLTGVYVTTDNDEIPYGFRLYDSYPPASGLDGATFLSIHPAAGKWPIIWAGISLGTVEHPDTFITSNALGHEFTVPDMGR